MTSILKARGELSSDELSEKYKELESKFELPEVNYQKFKNNNDMEIINTGGVDSPLVVSIRMPQDSHRIMLFDKIQNIIETEVRK